MYIKLKVKTKAGCKTGLLVNLKKLNIDKFKIHIEFKYKVLCTSHLVTA